MSNSNAKGRNRFSNVNPGELIKLLADIMSNDLEAKRPLSVGFVGLVFDHSEEGVINMCVMNPAPQPDIIYSQLHDLANAVKAHLRAEIAKQQQSGLVIAQPGQIPMPPLKQ